MCIVGLRDFYRLQKVFYFVNKTNFFTLSLTTISTFIDEVEVDNYFCNRKANSLPNTNGLQENFNPNENTRPCYLPCPGECSMNKWSLWSRCQDDCKVVDKIKHKFRSSTGIQSRSRVAIVTGKVIFLKI